MNRNSDSTNYKGGPRARNQYTNNSGRNIIYNTNNSSNANSLTNNTNYNTNNTNNNTNNTNYNTNNTNNNTNNTNYNTNNTNNNTTNYNQHSNNYNSPNNRNYNNKNTINNNTTYNSNAKRSYYNSNNTTYNEKPSYTANNNYNANYPTYSTKNHNKKTNATKSSFNYNNQIGNKANIYYDNNSNVSNNYNSNNSTDKTNYTANNNYNDIINNDTTAKFTPTHYDSKTNTTIYVPTSINNGCNNQITYATKAKCNVETTGPSASSNDTTENINPYNYMNSNFNNNNASLDNTPINTITDTPINTITDTPTTTTTDTPINTTTTDNITNTTTTTDTPITTITDTPINTTTDNITSTTTTTSTDTTNTTSDAKEAETTPPRAEMNHVDGIREVYIHEIEEAFQEMKDISVNYRCVSMDTEFPGTVATCLVNEFDKDSIVYHDMRCNVDILKIIQIGLTFADEKGQKPSPVHTWQFNMQFSEEKDMVNATSLELLKSCGLEFEKHDAKGILDFIFGNMLIKYRLICNPSLLWITFHGSNDFGYLIKCLVRTSLPANPTLYFDLLRYFFPCVIDVKCLLAVAPHLNGGLSQIAQQLNVVRYGHQHQAGSDSLVTSDVFAIIRKDIFDEYIGDNNRKLYFNQRLFGLDAQVSTLVFSSRDLSVNEEDLDTLAGLIIASEKEKLRSDQRKGLAPINNVPIPVRRA